MSRLDAMTANPAPFQLHVRRVEQTCWFDLTWGQGQRLSAELSYPSSLEEALRAWQAAYLDFYKTELRGRAAASGAIAVPPIDRHKILAQAETKLLYEFHQWLRQAALGDIRVCIAKTARERTAASRSRLPPILKILVACEPLDLARLPWETWELIDESAIAAQVRISRMPTTIRGVPATALGTKLHKRRGKARVLVIIGDETGLNFEADRAAVRSLRTMAHLTFVGWQPEKAIPTLKQEIFDAIADERGWDVLLFAGHSNETDLGGGELGIAPNAALSIQEIAPALTIAKERGLQFALFNSCKGLHIASSLIDLGLNQVAIMREPIHNRVAQEFLVGFLKRLAAFDNVREALLAASQTLKLQKHLTYPSAYLVPSLFHHPGAKLYQLPPVGYRQWLRRWLPTWGEALALTALVAISWPVSWQGHFLERRVQIQAIYRQITQQIPKASPPVLLVQIDEISIRRGKISEARPMDRNYLAKLIDQLADTQAKVVGIDYILDRHQPKNRNDQTLAASLQAAIKQHQTWFVFAAQQGHAGDWLEVLPDLAHSNWRLQGNITAYTQGDHLRYLTPAPLNDDDPRRLPFAYAIALAHQLNVDSAENSPQPSLDASRDWFEQVREHLSETREQDYRDVFGPSARLRSLTNTSYLFRQMWLHPIIDFSLPPESIYRPLSAWQVLEQSEEFRTLDWTRPLIILLAPGGYGEAGVFIAGEDNFALPAATRYWYGQKSSDEQPRQLFGGEFQAYAIHHFLQQHLVVPIPTLWLIGIAALLGKGTALWLEHLRETSPLDKPLRSFSGQRVAVQLGLLAGATALYGIASLQLYISAQVLLPWLFPTATLWAYILLTQVRTHSRG